MFSLGTPASSHRPKTNVRLIVDSKLSLGEIVTVDGCLSRSCLCSPVMDWRSASRPMTAGIGSSPPTTLNWIKRV